MLFNGSGLADIEGFAGRDAVDHVDKDHIGQLFFRNAHGGGCTNIAGSDNRNLFPHDKTPFKIKN
jgi:hypothetical protein